jgi:glycosyltransferase involved in cell wall biosynthesis
VLKADISLILPTRRRASLVYRLLDSIKETTADPDKLEIILYVDEDDSESYGISYPALPITKLINPPGNTMGKITNICYEASIGRYIMLLNDDVIFHTPKWDLVVKDAFRQFSDDIALLYGNDLDQGKKVPTFPIVSRTVCKIMGNICPSEYVNLHIENHLFDIFKKLGRLGYKRIRYLKDVIFEHQHYVLGKSKIDKTYVKKAPELDDRLFIAMDEDRHRMAIKIAQYIERQNHSEYQPPSKNYSKLGKAVRRLLKTISFSKVKTESY